MNIIDIYNASEAELLNGSVSAPGRIRSFLLNPDQKSQPHSCVLIEYDNDLPKLLDLTATDLKGGAGVKVVLDRFLSALSYDCEWGFTLGKGHLDHDKITELQLKTFTTEPNTFDHVIKVQDSMLTKPNMPGEVGIIGSWKQFITFLKLGESVCLDLSNLRPAGTVNGSGLIATGPVGYGEDHDNSASFWGVYSYIANHLEQGDIFSLMQLLGCLNDTLRRGGFKRGIVCSSLPYSHPDIKEYLECDITQIPGSHKKSVKVDEGILHHPELIDMICEATNAQGIFWERMFTDSRHMNVCVGIRIKNRGTCLLWRVNLGKCTTLGNISESIVEATKNVVKLHTEWREKVDIKTTVAALEDDNQVAVDVMGLANLLRISNVTYRDFYEALWRYVDDVEDYENPADLIVQALVDGYAASTAWTDEYMESLELPRLDYIHTVEPAQSHSFETKDSDGFTTARGIWPPIGRRQKRGGNSQKSKLYKLGPVETIKDYGPNFNLELSDAYFRMMKKAGGRAHGISCDDHAVATPERFKWWLTETELPAKYYQETTTFKEQQTLQKTAVMTEELNPKACSIINRNECSVCAE